MNKKRAVFLLRLAFLLGAAADAAAIVPMVSNQSANALWGFAAFPDPYGFAMAMGASLMAGWTLLLIWAFFKPLERRMVAPMTVLVVIGLVVAEIIAIRNGVLPFGKAIVSLILQALIIVLYSFAFTVSSRKMLKS